MDNRQGQNWKEIQELLHGKAEQFCREFLPNGRREGDYWRTGDILDGASNGRYGKSFLVYISGPKAGYWIENGTPVVSHVGKGGGKSGGLFDIIMAQKGLKFPDAVKFAKDWLGIKDNGSFRTHIKAPVGFGGGAKKEYISASHLIPIIEGDCAYKYLCVERGIPLSVVRKYRVQRCKRWFAYFGKEVDAIAFPIYSGKGEKAELLNIKYLALERKDGKKYCSQEKGGGCNLFGWQAVDMDADELVICEGEIDALTLATVGVNAVSVPEGAHADTPEGKSHAGNAWINNDWERLEKFSEIKVCMDSDDVGQAASETIMRRLGFERTSKVEITPPFKDPNDMFINGDAEEIAVCVQRAMPKEPITLAHAEDFASRLKDRLDGLADTVGRALPWNLGGHFRIRNFELTLVTGYSGHGKTAWLNDLLINLCHMYDETCCIASQEVPADQTLQVMFCQATGKKHYKDKEGREYPGLFKNAVDWLNSHILFFNKVGRVDLQEILDTFAFCYKRYGTKLFCLDSFMCLGDVSQIDIESQSAAIQKMCDFVMNYGVHLFLVTHSKKPDQKKPEDKYQPEKHDINGSIHISDLAHNVISVWRNIKKNEHIEKAKDEESRKAAMQEIDAKMCVRKQRNGTGTLPGKNLWFDITSRQYRDKYTGEVRAIVKPDVIENNEENYYTDDDDEDIF